MSCYRYLVPYLLLLIVINNIHIVLLPLHLIWCPPTPFTSVSPIALVFLILRDQHWASPSLSPPPSHACHNEDTRRGDERAPRQRIGWPCPPLSSLNCFCLHHHHPCSKAAEAYGIPKAQAILPHCLASPSFSEELLVLSLGLSDPSAMSSSQHEVGEGQQEKLRDNHNMERPQKRWLLRYQAAMMRGRYDVKATWGKWHEQPQWWWLLRG